MWRSMRGTFNEANIIVNFVLWNVIFQELYSWDKGNQLTYPVRYHDIGYNITGKDDKTDSLENPKALGLTGFSVHHRDEHALDNLTWGY